MSHTSIPISLIVSLIALAISVITFWLARLQRGTVKMTRPTVIFMGPDGGGERHHKVFIRTLLYSTADRGRYIQNMYVRLQRGTSVQDFNVWVYDDGAGIVRGSGLFVNKNGLSANHHFLNSRDSMDNRFAAGEYILQVYAEIANEHPKMIFEETLTITTIQEDEMNSKNAGVYFDWASNTQSYSSHIDVNLRDRLK